MHMALQGRLVGVNVPHEYAKQLVYAIIPQKLPVVIFYLCCTTVGKFKSEWLEEESILKKM